MTASDLKEVDAVSASRVSERPNKSTTDGWCRKVRYQWGIEVRLEGTIMTCFSSYQQMHDRWSNGSYLANGKSRAPSPSLIVRTLMAALCKLEHAGLMVVCTHDAG